MSIDREEVMDIQRLRNLTTGRLHTETGHIYQDLEYLTGEKGIMTHMIPNAMRSLEPWLRGKVTDPRFWDGEYDTTHQGEFDIEPMTAEERKQFFDRYYKMPSPLEGKKVIGVVI
jgi:hypothetical protein